MFRVAGTYVVVAWVLMQAGEIVFPAFELPNRALRLLILFLVAGFPVVVVLAWFLDVTPGGVRLTRGGPAEASDEPAAAGAPGQLGRSLEMLLLGFAIPLFAFASLLIVLTFRGADATDPDDAPRVAGDAGEPSLAVLPFEDLSLAPEERDVFARGMHEEILTHLARLPGVRLLASASVLDAEGRARPLEALDAELAVDHVLRGTIRRSPERVRVSARLIHVRSREQIWASAFDADLEASLLVQARIADQLAEALRLEVAADPPGSPSVADASIDSLPALDAYLKARDVHRRATASDAGSLHRAQILYEEALRFDEGLARAWLQLGILHAELYWFGHDRSAARAALTRACLDRAREEGVEPDRLAVGEGIAAYYVDRDYGRALLHFDEVVRDAPGDADAHFYRAMVLRRSGTFAASLEAHARARQLDPMNPGSEDEFALTLMLAGRLTEARRMLADLLSRDPSRAQSRARLWQATLELDGRPSRLLDDVIEASALVPPSLRGPWVLELGVLANEVDRGLAALPRGGAGDGSQDVLLSGVFMAAGAGERARLAAEDARRKLDRILRARPDRVDDRAVQQSQAWIEFRLGDAEGGLARMSALVEAFPVEADVIVGGPLLWDLLLMQLEANRPEAAARSLDRLAARAAPGSIPGGGYYRLAHWPTYAAARAAPVFQAALVRHRPAYAERWGRPGA
ncbi:MAG: FlgO family outer membrane protein [Myxococcota bacterium]